MKRLMHVLAVAVLAGSVSVAFGQAGGGGGGAGGGAGVGGFGGGGFGGGQGFGQGRGGRAGGRGGPGGLNLNFYATEYDLMAEQLTLSDEQKTKVKEKVDAMNKELETFQQNAMTQVAANRGGRGRARAGGAGGGPGGGAGGVGGGGGAGQDTMRAQMAKLQDDFRLLVDEHQLKIDSDLTPEQRITWETFKLNRMLDPRINQLSLSDDQKEKVKQLVEGTGKELAAATEGKEVAVLEGRMIRKLVGEVLTEEQAAKFVEPPLLMLGGRGGRGGFGGGGGGAGGGAGFNGGAGGGRGQGGRGGRNNGNLP